jgi:hypothetical protein
MHLCYSYGSFDAKITEAPPEQVKSECGVACDHPEAFRSGYSQRQPPTSHHASVYGIYPLFSVRALRGHLLRRFIHLGEPPNAVLCDRIRRVAAV